MATITENPNKKPNFNNDAFGLDKINKIKGSDASALEFWFPDINNPQKLKEIYEKLGIDESNIEGNTIKKNTGKYGKSNQEQMERRNITKSTTPPPILTGDDEKKSFFDRLLSKENRPFLENLGMKLGTTLTAPMNPGENRSLINQVATSIQGASDKTSADEAAEVAKLLAGAQAKKALAESGGQTTLIKNALANVAMQFPNLDQNSDAFKQKVAQAMRQFGIKDITTAQINSYIKLSQLESELKMLEDPKNPDYIKKALEIEAFKKNLAEGGLGAGGGDGRTIVKFEDL